MKNRADVYGTGRSHRAAQLSFPLALLSSVSDMCCTPVLLSLRPVASFIQVTNWIFFNCLLNSSKTSLHTPYLTSTVISIGYGNSPSLQVVPVTCYSLLFAKATLPGTGWAWIGFGDVMSSLPSYLGFIYLLLNVFAFFSLYSLFST